MNPEVFRIHVSDPELSDLKERLARTRWTHCVENAGWDYGVHDGTLRRLIHYWQESFDWRKQENAINEFPQFRMKIDDLRIHFVHLRSANLNAIPLILTHGWPGSFVELLTVAKLLQEHFHVVVPSLPGYGFSDASTRPGMNGRLIASIWVKLMNSLGYTRFIAQGGDWGATVSTWIGLDFPQSLMGIHLNYIPGSYQPSDVNELSDGEKAFLKSKDDWLDMEGAYGHIQGTKPQSLAFGIEDSPAGLAAWILEKVHGWSYCEGDIFNHISMDDVLTNIMIYWISKSFGSSIRLYFEARKSPLHLQSGKRINVPTAVARFAKEEPMPPREWVERGYNLVRWTEYPIGSHYVHLEAPELLAKDTLESSESWR